MEILLVKKSKSSSLGGGRYIAEYFGYKKSSVLQLVSAPSLFRGK
ncbi:hypothetical protein [[Limnothrix rosea] IAM M-220]|nr:hypothetical protein [[Limnothrix rosea] IAM M-220]